MKRKDVFAAFARKLGISRQNLENYRINDGRIYLPYLQSIFTDIKKQLQSDRKNYNLVDEFGMVALETVTNQYLGGDTSLACSPETQAKIDQLVVDLVERQHQKALQILRDDRQKLDELARFLHEKETITGQEFMSILNA